MNVLPITQSPVATNERDIHWKQLWSLAALYALVIIGWIAYRNYQPRLLVQFGFTGLTSFLIVAQAVIMIITPLISGRVGDRYRSQQGHRLPVITAGISLAAMVFMAVAFTLLVDPGETLRWILPLLVVLWLISMSIFTSPALSTVELFTPIDKLPRAMAVLTITGNLVYAVEPVIIELIDYVGAPFTFMLGGVLVFFSGYALKQNSLGLFQVSGGEGNNTSANGPAVSPYGFIFLLGLSVGLATTVLFYFLPVVFTERSHTIFSGDVSYLVAGILLFSAVLSWPLSTVVNRHGIERSFWVGLCLFFAVSAGLYLITSAAMVLMFLALFAVSFSTLSVSSLPLAIRRAAAHEKVFCVGLFFSGVAVPEGVCVLLF